MRQSLVSLVLFAVVSTVFADAPVENLTAESEQVQPSAVAQSTGGDVASAPTSLPSQQVIPMPNHKVDLTNNNPLIGGAATQSVSSSSAAPANTALPISSRVDRLETQMQNMIQANDAQKLADLQQQIQQLSGELQVQQHDIKLLNQQLRNFYKDLSSQIKQQKNLSSDGNSDNSASSTAPATKKPSKVDASKSAAAASAYQVALNLMMKKQYMKAAQAFNRYLADYPHDALAVNAHYWLGEIYVQQKKLTYAVAQFNRVIEGYPASVKVADAKVKIAIIHAAQGKDGLAKREFLAVKTRYPNSTAARLAAVQLQQLSLS